MARACLLGKGCATLFSMTLQPATPAEEADLYVGVTRYVRKNGSECKVVRIHGMRLI